MAKKKKPSEKILDKIDKLKTAAEQAKVQRETPITEKEFLEKLKENENE